MRQHASCPARHKWLKVPLLPVMNGGACDATGWIVGMRYDWKRISLRKAQEFVRRHHRHHPPPRVHSFSLGLFLDNVLIAVLIAAPPIARALDDGRTIEVSCLCTLGHRNAASQLLGHFGRIARDFNYYSLTTYTLATEEGASLRASGWHPVAVTNGRPWGSTSRPRKPARWPEGRKRRWVRDLRERAPNQVALAHVQRQSSWPVGDNHLGRWGGP
jgi:hypothetical protein